jgi:hypothetical protein
MWEKFFNAFELILVETALGPNGFEDAHLYEVQVFDPGSDAAEAKKEHHNQ